MRGGSSGRARPCGSARGGCTRAVAGKSRSGCCATHSSWWATAAGAKEGSSCSGRRGVIERRRVPAQVELTRQRLVRAALELFTAQGFHVTTTPHIAKKAGVAEGTIYRHFASKQHLLNELYRAAARWGLQLVKEADGLNVGPRAKLAELGRSLVAGASREPAAARLFLIQRHGDLLDDDSRKLARDFSLDLEALVAQAKAEGSVKPGAAEVWAAVWLSVVTLAIDRVSAKQWPETHAAVQLSLDAAWDAIAALPPPTPGGQADGGSGGQ